MKRELAIDKTLAILLNNTKQDSNLYAPLFDNYKNAQTTPISPLYFDKVDGQRKVVITEDAYNELENIRDFTCRSNREIAFFIFGEEREDSVLWLDTVITTYDAKMMPDANFESIKPFLNDIINGYKNGDYKNSPKQIICHGHTHSRTTEAQDNFSFGDLISYVEFANSNPVFINKEMGNIGCLLNPSGDFNFIHYSNDPQNDNFYMFDEVYVMFDKGVKKQLPAYQKGNYLRDEQKVL